MAELRAELLLRIEMLKVEFVIFVKLDELTIELLDIEELQLVDEDDAVEVGSPQNP